MLLFKCFLTFSFIEFLSETDTFIPNFGVYSGKIYIDNNIFNTIVNIGLNPTVDDQATLKIEAHIFDFSSDIYNSKVEISLSKL